MPKLMTLDDQISRFNSGYKILENGCWEWLGKTMTSNGFTYGRTPFGRYPDGRVKIAFAHRVSYELHNGELISGHHIHHKCENPLCVNPKHLKQLTPREHMIVSHGSRANKALLASHCVNGHLLGGENISNNSRGWRTCKTCRNNRARGYKSTKRFDRFTQERVYESSQANKTHCPLGHPYSGNNLKWENRKCGWTRSCKTCVYIKSKFAYEKRMGRAINGIREFLENWQKYGLKQDPNTNFYPD